MTVEDFVEILAQQVNRGLYIVFQQDEWASKFVRNVAEYTASGKPLSTEQARIILKLLRRDQGWLMERGVLDAGALSSLLTAPRYRQTPYPSANVPREVRYLGRNLLGFRFKRNDVIVRALRQLMPEPDQRLTDIWFHRDHRLWVVPVTRETLDGVMRVIREHRFDFDDGVIEQLSLFTETMDRPPAFVADRELGVIAGHVYACEFTTWWVDHVLGGEEL